VLFLEWNPYLYYVLYRRGIFKLYESMKNQIDLGQTRFSTANRHWAWRDVTYYKKTVTTT